MLRRFLIVGLIVSVLGNVWLFREARFRKQQLKDSTFLHIEAEALASKIILEELRQGRVSNCLELLEMNLDSGMAVLAKAPYVVSPSAATNASETIDVLKAYREKYPRKTEAVIDLSEGR